MVSKKLALTLKGVIVAGILATSFTSYANDEGKKQRVIQLETMKWWSLDELFSGGSDDQEILKCNPYPRCKTNPKANSKFEKVKL